LRALDEQVFTLKSEVNLIKNENSRYEVELRGHSDKVPLPELEKSVKKLHDEVDELKIHEIHTKIHTKIHELKSAKTEVVSKEEKTKVYKHVSLEFGK
jgi:predicted  nucleic acid-binding Zn-ribbon protein